jgi:hypothetical protein
LYGQEQYNRQQQRYSHHHPHSPSAFVRTIVDSFPDLDELPEDQVATLTWCDGKQRSLPSALYRKSHPHHHSPNPSAFVRRVFDKFPDPNDLPEEEVSTLTWCGKEQWF